MLLWPRHPSEPRSPRSIASGSPAPVSAMSTPLGCSTLPQGTHDILCASSVGSGSAHIPSEMRIGDKRRSARLVSPSVDSLTGLNSPAPSATRLRHVARRSYSAEPVSPTPQGVVPPPSSSSIRPGLNRTPDVAGIPTQALSTNEEEAKGQRSKLFIADYNTSPCTGPARLPEVGPDLDVDSAFAPTSSPGRVVAPPPSKRGEGPLSLVRDRSVRFATPPRPLVSSPSSLHLSCSRSKVTCRASLPASLQLGSPIKISPPPAHLTSGAPYPASLFGSPSPRSRPAARSPRLTSAGEPNDPDQSFDPDLEGDLESSESVLEAEICHITATAPPRSASASIRTASWSSCGSSVSTSTAPSTATPRDTESESEKHTPRPPQAVRLYISASDKAARDEVQELRYGSTLEPVMVLDQSTRYPNQSSLSLPLSVSASMSEASTPGAITPPESTLEFPILVIPPPGSDARTSLSPSSRPARQYADGEPVSLDRLHPDPCQERKTSHRTRKPRRPTMAPLPPPRRGSLVDFTLYERPPAIPRASLPDLGLDMMRTNQPLPSMQEALLRTNGSGLSLQPLAEISATEPPLPSAYLDQAQALVQLQTLLARQSQVASLVASLQRLHLELQAQYEVALALLDERELAPNVRGCFERRLEGWWTQQNEVLRASKARADARWQETDFWVRVLQERLNMEGADMPGSKQKRFISPGMLELLPPPLTAHDLDRQIWEMEAVGQIPMGTLDHMLGELEDEWFNESEMPTKPLFDSTPLDRTAGHLPLAAPMYDRREVQAIPEEEKAMARSVTMKREKKVCVAVPTQAQIATDTREKKEKRKSKVLSWIW